MNTANRLVIDLQAYETGKPHWLNVEARHHAAVAHLQVINSKIASLLHKPPHILIDPQWATTSFGDFLHHAFDADVRCIERFVGHKIAVPARQRWNVSDLGGGITREQLLELAAQTDAVNRFLAA